MNPTYYQFRLWLFSPYGNVAVDLDRESIRRTLSALGIARRLLISNVVFHGEASGGHSQYKFRVRLTTGEQRYLTAQLNKHVFGRRSRRSKT
jgi:hypothetical protein